MYTDSDLVKDAKQTSRLAKIRYVVADAANETTRVKALQITRKAAEQPIHS